MTVITYNAKLIGSQEDLASLKEILNWHRFAFNSASVVHFGAKKNSIKELHGSFYEKFRRENPNIPSQVVIRGEQECLSAYRSIKSNKHKIDKPIEKKKLSMRLDKRLYSTKEKTKINITTSKGRKRFEIKLFDKLISLLGKYDYQDPLIFERNGEIFISLTFKTGPTEKVKPKSVLGIDLGIRISAACSDGRLIRDKKFNKEKRKLRFLKRQLQSKRTKSARRHLKKIRRKECNKNKNQSHLIVNEILKTNAEVIAVEDLKGIKKKKHKRQNKNKISQVPFYQLKQILSYKAHNLGKQVVDVKPHYTSQDDSVTGKRDGIRKGRRYYSKNGLIYDADINASINIAKKTNLPLSPPVCKNWMLDGAGRIVNLPIVCKPSVNSEVLQAPML